MIDTSKQSTTNDLQFYRFSDNVFDINNPRLLQAIEKLKITSKNNIKITCSIGFNFKGLSVKKNNLILDEKHFMITDKQFSGVAILPLHQYTFAKNTNNQTILQKLLHEYQKWYKERKAEINKAVRNDNLAFLISCHWYSNSINDSGNQYANIFTWDSLISFVAQHFNTFANIIYRDNLDDMYLSSSALRVVEGDEEGNYDVLIKNLLVSPNLQQQLQSVKVLRVLLDYILLDNIENEQPNTIWHKALYQQIVTNSAPLLINPAKLYDRLERNDYNYKRIISTLMRLELQLGHTQLTYNFSDIPSLLEIYDEFVHAKEDTSSLGQFHFKLINKEDLNLLLKLIGEHINMIYGTHILFELPKAFIQSLKLDFNHQENLLSTAKKPLLQLQSKDLSYNSRIFFRQQIDLLNLLQAKAKN